MAVAAQEGADRVDRALEARRGVAIVGLAAQLPVERGEALADDGEVEGFPVGEVAVEGPLADARLPR